MKEYSLESLKNDTDDVVSTVKDGLLGSDNNDGPDENETPHETPKVPSHNELPQRAVLPDNALTKSGIEAESESGDNSDGADQSGNPDQFNFPTTTPPIPTPWTPTPNLTPTPTATRNASAYESVTQIATPDSSSSVSGGAIAGLVVGIACVMFVIAGFVTMKKRTANQRLSLSKMPSNFGDSQAVPLAKSKLAPPGAFGKLNSRRNHHEEPEMSNMSGIFTISQDDPFTRRHMRKGGIWDDPPTEAAILQMVAVGNLQVEFSRDCPVELLTLAHACISVEPDDRPTAAEALHKLQIALKSFEVEEVTL
ncbi:hypothetical protein JG687_00017782 [Phytophthora cactorum]|uniref:Protein kinase-like domain n=1 Tax=Phytophthora cactorum TaxID=29920 RepID=A0A8T1TNE9_9STRA|nr:hypothetical protein JG687_00017782 [Phytophthora cactorum]